MNALIIVDIQNDFAAPSGSLLVPGGLDIVPLINQIQQSFDFVILTQDWHPSDHSSFKEHGRGGVWPVHCVQGTWGAELMPALDTRSACAIIRKGMYPLIDSYSAFADEDGTPTGLGGLLEELGVEKVAICGLAFEYCVRETALHAVQMGFETHIIGDACRSVHPEFDHESWDVLDAAGVHRRTSEGL